MKSKLVDTSSSISNWGRANTYWLNKKLKPHSSEPASSKTDSEIDLAEILKNYNLKGFEFGNWMSNNDRYDRAIACRHALCLLSQVVGSKNLGLDCLIGIAFGARGRGGSAAAHYEPSENMINISKPKGDGCLAHEWGHALDYNFGRYVSQNKRYDTLSGGHSMQRELKDNKGDAIRNAMESLIRKAWQTDSLIQSTSDGVSEYWHCRTEIFARLFEQWVCYKLRERNVSNNFLTARWDYYITAAHYWNENDMKKLVAPMNSLMSKIKVEMNRK